jgi:transcriptional regulator with XRE-family HTH domain
MPENVPHEAHSQSAVERRWTVRSGADIGRAIAEIRRSRGLTQAALATQSGLSRHWLAKMETGRSAVVLDHMLRVLRRLGATITISFFEPTSTTGDIGTDPGEFRG